MTTIGIDIGGPGAPRPRLGLEDGGFVSLSCSNCRKPLATLWVTKPRADIVWRVRASCPYCGDKSYIQEVRGLFHPAGHGIPNPDNPDDPDDNLVITSIASIGEEKDSDGNPVVLFVVKEQK